MSSLATRHFQKCNLLLAGTMDFKKIENLEFLKKVLNSGGEQWILKNSKTWNF
jgi:hypothetical protein